MRPDGPQDLKSSAGSTVTLPRDVCDLLDIAYPTPVGRIGNTRIDTPDGAVWVKTVEPPRRSLNTLILPTISFLAPAPILRRSKAGKGGDTLLRQAQRIRALHTMGLSVPTIRYADRDLLITADCGQTMERFVRYADARNEHGLDETGVRDIIMEITRTLADMHRHGTAHGRPKVRDFAWRNGKVTILDLEEQPEEVMPIADAQARDIFLWVHDLCSAELSRKIAPDSVALLCATMTDATRGSLRRFLRLLRVAALPARLMLRVLPKNRELTSGIAAHDILRDTFST